MIETVGASGGSFSTKMKKEAPPRPFEKNRGFTLDVKSLSSY